MHAAITQRLQPIRWTKGIAEHLGKLIPSIHTFELTLLITLLTLLLYAPKPWYARFPLLALAVVALLFQHMRTSKMLWFSCSALCAGYVIGNYHSADNHKFLLAYWTFAIFLSLHARDPAAELASSARLLVGLAMGFAVLWKSLAPDYLNGEFFAHELVFDPRLRSPARLLAGVDEAIFEANRAALDKVKDGLVATATFAATPGTLPLAKALSWFGLGIEALIALAFLAPPASVLGRFRDLPLQVFLAVVYPITTVMGFAYLLAAMGLAQARDRRIAVVYVGLVVFMQLYPMKWGLFL